MFNTENKNPKVSIIIPVYNGYDYLQDSIEAALNQTYSNIEVIVVNDGSNDEGRTEKIAKSFGNRIKYIFKENGGVSSALNFGIDVMEGEYFSWLSHDDLYSKSKVSDSIELLTKYDCLNDGKTIAFTSGYYIDSKGKKTHSFKNIFQENKIYSGTEVVNLMTIKGTLNGCCMLIPKKVFGKFSFNEDLRYSQDSLMWYQIFIAGCKLIFENGANVMYRLHGNQTSQTRRDLYEHDTLYIANILADNLLELDSDGNIFCQYVNRIAKNQCHDALVYLIQCAENSDKITSHNIKKLKKAILLGKARYAISRIYKRIFIKR